MNYDLNPIVVYTANSYKQMKELQRYHLRNLRYISIGAAIIALLLIIYGLVIFSQSGGFNQIFTYGILYTIISIFLWLASNGVHYTSKRHESITHLMRNGVTVFFRNSRFETDFKHYESEGKCNYSYSTLYSVRETKDMIYLFLSKNTVVLVDKNGFLNGTIEELRNLLRYNLPAIKVKLY